MARWDKTEGSKVDLNGQDTMTEADKSALCFFLQGMLVLSPELMK